MRTVTVPVPVRRVAYRIAHALLRTYWRVARPHTRGVKCVVRDGDAVVFVRHAYGDRRAWELPGGGIKRGEDPRDTAAREAREELGVDLEDWRALGSVESYGYGKRTTVVCFEAHSPDRTLTVDAGEIEEAGWFALDQLPVPLGTDARVVLERLVTPPRSG
jgi:8-oxo-dGTP pyrophosphatase MutT (NUDIX family)